MNCLLPARQKAGARPAGGIFLPEDMPSAMHDVPSAEPAQRSWQKAGLRLAGGRFLRVDMPSAVCDVPSAELAQGSW